MSQGKTADTEIRTSLHALNNALHVFGLQAELAKLYMEHGDYEKASEALDIVLLERSECGQAVRLLQKACQKCLA